MRSWNMLLFLLGFILVGCASTPPKQPNVLFIICDDLNDYISCMDGHPQTKTPHIQRFADSGVVFQRAYCNSPVCNPSRCSLLTGIYPHSSQTFAFDRWKNNEVLRNSKTIMEHFRDNGYRVLGTGKLMHFEEAFTWEGAEFKNRTDYGPFPFDGEKEVAHPSVPAAFRSIGKYDGSYGSLADQPYASEQDDTKGWVVNGKKPYYYKSDDDRDRTPDEINAQWAADQLKQFSASPSEQPFFMAVGFVRPHTPLHVPQRFFDLFPADSLQLPTIKPHDNADCHYLESFESDAVGLQYGPRFYQLLKKSYPNIEDGLRVYIAAYLACVAAVDENIGQVMDALDASRFRDNTIVVLTSDHGYNMGEKDYLFKNSLWEESTRVPLIVRAPHTTKPGSEIFTPVSLIDLYPTLIDLCGLTGDTRKNEMGKAIDGYSVRPLLEGSDSWEGPDAALSTIYTEKKYHTDPSNQHWAVRSDRWRYIRYNTGKEELYDHQTDPYEWTNLANQPIYAPILKAHKTRLENMTGLSFTP